MENNFKKSRGQFFTTKNKVLDVLVSLIKNNGSILEPSAGEGHIIQAIENKLNKNVEGVELDVSKVDSKICNSTIKVDNFFNFIKNCGVYNTVIGNPPFVKLKNVEESTIKLLPEKIPANGNLYYFFIKYCVSILEKNGELIFIVPKEWLYNTSSQFLRDYLKNKGNFTHFIDCGEEKLFDDADVPSLCIFRYEIGYNGKTNFYNSLDDYNNKILEKKKVFFGNTICFSNKKHDDKKISDFFDIKVGLVSGKENIFKINEINNFEDNGIVDIMTTSKEYSQYIFLEDFNNYSDIPQRIKNYLDIHKDTLLNRQIKNFNETNWWKYGAIRNIELMKSSRKRIYGLMKTRDTNPFWIGEPGSLFSGGVFALFLKENNNLDINKATEYLNSDEFKNIMKESNLYSNNKVSITPTAFSSLPFNILD